MKKKPEKCKNDRIISLKIRDADSVSMMGERNEKYSSIQDPLPTTVRYSPQK